MRTRLPWVNASPKVFELLRNPFWNEEQPGVLQSTGWQKAWTAVASPYEVRARTPPRRISSSKAGSRRSEERPDHQALTIES